MVTVRPLSPDDSLEELTELLHRAYARLAAMNLRFVATHQDVETTRERAGSGQCLVAAIDGRVVGTITLYLASNSDEGYYSRNGVAHFGQFGVEPSAQGRGVGRKLLDAVEEMARRHGCTELALDTSEKASHLIDRYERWGYAIVDRVRWDSVNYESVIMSKPLTV